MNLKLKKIFVALWLVLSTALMLVPAFPISVLAQERAPASTDTDRCKEFEKQFEVGGGNIIEGRPFFCSATDIILYAIRILTVLAGIVTTLFLVVGGFWYLTSAGNEEQTEKGKKTIINSIIGLVVVMLAYTIVRLVSSTLSQPN